MISELFVENINMTQLSVICDSMSELFFNPSKIALGYCLGCCFAFPLLMASLEFRARRADAWKSLLIFQRPWAVNIPSSPSSCLLSNLHLQDFKAPAICTFELLKHAETISPSHAQPCALSLSHTCISEHWLGLSTASYTQKQSKHMHTFPYAPEDPLLSSSRLCAVCVLGLCQMEAETKRRIHYPELFV